MNRRDFTHTNIVLYSTGDDHTWKFYSMVDFRRIASYKISSSRASDRMRNCKDSWLIHKIPDFASVKAWNVTLGNHETFLYDRLLVYKLHICCVCTWNTKNDSKIDSSTKITRNIDFDLVFAIPYHFFSCLYL